MSTLPASGAAPRRSLPTSSPPQPRRPGLKLVAGRPARPRRAPFVVLVLVVLGVGLIGLLLLNTALQQGTFELRDLERENRILRDRHAELSEAVADRSAPDELARRAAELGMVPAPQPETLVVDDVPSSGG